MTTTIIIPINKAAAVNAALAAMGHGANNLSVGVRVRPGNGPADHMAAHAWGNDQFVADLEALRDGTATAPEGYTGDMSFPGLQVLTGSVETDAEGNPVPVAGVNFGAAMKFRGLERVPEPDAI
jgi:hypothetical protein